VAADLTVAGTLEQLVARGIPSRDHLAMERPAGLPRPLLRPSQQDRSHTLALAGWVGHGERARSPQHCVTNHQPGGVHRQHGIGRKIEAARLPLIEHVAECDVRRPEVERLPRAHHVENLGGVGEDRWPQTNHSSSIPSPRQSSRKHWADPLPGGA
jgi:hypothetical protein